jgi:uncharacterized protein
MLYADTSAIIRAYLRDEPDQPALQRLLLGGAEAVVTSEITRVEFGGAMVRATRAGRIRRATDFIRRFDRDCDDDAAISLIPFDRDMALRSAQRVAVDHGLKALDAVHLAVALAAATAASATVEPFRFVTRDQDQAMAARAEGLTVI